MQDGWFFLHALAGKKRLKNNKNTLLSRTKPSLCFEDCRKSLDFNKTEWLVTSISQVTYILNEESPGKSFVFSKFLLKFTGGSKLGVSRNTPKLINVHLDTLVLISTSVSIIFSS